MIANNGGDGLGSGLNVCMGTNLYFLYVLWFFCFFLDFVVVGSLFYCFLW